MHALNNRCFVHAVVGDLRSALADCNAALKQRPFFVDALDSRGLVFLKLNMLPERARPFDAALKLNAKLASSLDGPVSPASAPANPTPAPPTGRRQPKSTRQHRRRVQKLGRAVVLGEGGITNH